MQSRRPATYFASLTIAFALGCGRSNDLARPEAPSSRATVAAAASSTTSTSEPPPTEAEGDPEIRALMEKAEGKGIHTRFWRRGAGTPGPDGWVTAIPTPGGFEIELPMLYSDFSQTSKATDGVVIELNAVGGPWEGGKVACTHMRRSDGSLGPAPALSVRKHWEDNPDTVSLRDRTWEGFPALEIESKSGLAHTQTLIVDAGTRGAFAVTADLPEAAWIAHRAEVDRFIHSLKTKLGAPVRP